MKEGLSTVLAAEDQESDAMILRIVFSKAGILQPLVVVRDGQEAVDYLAGRGAYAARSLHPSPALILLDLKMPRMNGFDVLAWLQTQPRLQDIPAVVLSASADESDVQRARQLGAREYFVKPFGLDDFVKIAQELQTRWLTPALVAAPTVSPEVSCLITNRLQAPDNRGAARAGETARGSDSR